MNEGQDDFNRYYQDNAAYARTDVEAAIQVWESVITNFNYHNIGSEGNAVADNTFQLRLLASSNAPQTFGETILGNTTHFQVDDEGKPVGAQIDLSFDPSAFYFDPTPLDKEAFTDVTDRFSASGKVAADPSGRPLVDFFTVVEHELGHALGMAADDYNRLAFGEFLSSTGLPFGQYELPGQSEPMGVFLELFQGSTTQALFGAAAGEGPHVYNGSLDGLPSDLPIYPYDLMTPFRTGGNQQLVSDLDARVLQDAYGYSVRLPSLLQTFLANFNPDTGILTLNVASTTTNLSLTRSGFDLVVSFDGMTERVPFTNVKGIQVNGARSHTAAIHLDFAGGSIIPAGGLSIHHGEADDLVVTGADTNFLLAGDGLTISDYGVISFAPDGDTTTGVRALGTISVSTPQDSQTVNTFTVSKWTGSVTLDGGGGGDLYQITFSGSSASPSGVTIADSGTKGTDAATIENAGPRVDVSNAVVSAGQSGLVYPGGVENLTLKGGDEPTTFTLNSTAYRINTTIVGGSKDDTLLLNHVDSLAPFTQLAFNGGGGSNEVQTTNDLGTPVNLSDGHLVVLLPGPQDQLFEQSGHTLYTPGDLVSTDIKLTNVQKATLTGSNGPNSFAVTDWDGTATLNGSASSDDVTVNFTGAHSGSITVNGNSGSDRFTVNLTGSGSGNVTINGLSRGESGTRWLTVRGTAGADPIDLTPARVRIGKQTVTYADVPSVSVDGQGGGDTYTVHLAGSGTQATTVADSGKSGTDALTITLPSIRHELSVGPAAVSLEREEVHYQGLEALTVRAGDGGTQNVHISGLAAGTATTIAGGLGAAVVDYSPGVGGFTFQGGAGTDEIIAPPADGTQHLTDTLLTLPGAAPVTLSSVEKAQLVGGPLGSSFEVDHWSGSATLAGNGGHNSYSVHLSGTSGGTTTIVDEPSTPSDLTVYHPRGTDPLVVTPTAVSATHGSATEEVKYDTLFHYDSVDHLKVVTGTAGAGNVVVRGTSPDTTTELQGGSFDDTFAVRSDDQAQRSTVDGVTSGLTIDGGAGNNTLTLEDAGEGTAHTVTLTPTQVGASSKDTFFGSGGSLTYSSLAAVTLNLGKSSTGNTVILNPSATTAFAINGGFLDPARVQGDSLSLDLTAVTDPQRQVMPSAVSINREVMQFNRTVAGTWTFGNRQPVRFTNIGKQNPSGFLINGPTGPEPLLITGSAALSADLSPPFAAVGAPARVQFPMGLFDLVIGDVAPGGATTVRVHLPTDVIVNSYWKHGPTPDNPVPHWYDFAAVPAGYDFAAPGAAGAEIDSVNHLVTLHFVDGQWGDDDLQANGQIRDPGAPAWTVPPTPHEDHDDVEASDPIPDPEVPASPLPPIGQEGEHEVQANGQSQDLAAPAAIVPPASTGAVPGGSGSTQARIDQGPISPSPIARISPVVKTKADVRLAQSVTPNPTWLGWNQAYTLTVSNHGPGTAVGLVVTDQLPAGVYLLSAQSSQGTCSASEGIIFCSLGDLPSGASATVYLLVTPTEPATLSNSASVTSSGDDIDPSDNQSTATSTVLPTPAYHFVVGLYRTVLGRGANTTEMDYWLRRFAAGASRLQVTQGFWESPEHRSQFVKKSYVTYLHRLARPDEQGYWTVVQDPGADEADMFRRIVTSPEYTAAHPTTSAFVEGLAADVLGRSLTAQEQTVWRWLSRFSLSREAIAQMVLDSAEAGQRFVGDCYGDLLHRFADTEGQGYWLALLHRRQATRQGIAEALLASDEFFASQAAHGG